jgi:hypothetical protein
MRISYQHLASTVLAAASCLTASPLSAETVGKAVSVRTIVTGANGELKVSDPVSRDERIKTNNSGLGQFQFLDGTKLAMGPNSAVIIDEYVLGSGNRVQKFTLNVTKGTLRWISGKSPSSAYTINTVAGTLGVRGTAVDIAVRGNSAMMVLLNGAARWCLPGRTNCVEVTRPCDFIIANGRNVSQPKRVTESATNQLGANSLPFLINNQRLLPSFQLGRANCGIGTNRFPTRKGSPDSPGTGPSRPSIGGGKGGGGDEGGEGGGLGSNIP